MDTQFFNKLNSSTKTKAVENFKNARSLQKSLKNWIGDYKRTYTNLRNGDISYKINNFKVILSNEPSGYEFKQIKKSMLKKGSYGYAVEVLQKYFDLPETGNFDEQLELKVKEFQSLNNSKPDGIVGPMTYKSLGL